MSNDKPRPADHPINAALDLAIRGLPMLATLLTPPAVKWFKLTDRATAGD